MRDDFGALDFLSAGNFRWSSVTPPPAPVKKRLFGFPRRRPAGAGKRRLMALLPRFTKGAAARRTAAGLQGWPVALSWPSRAAGDARSKVGGLW